MMTAADERAQLEFLYTRYGIKTSHRQDIERYLDLLGARDRDTKLHVIRVAVLGGRIGEELRAEGIEPKPLVWAGLLHDIGKALVDPDLFKKTARFTEEDYRRMEPHVEYGWRMLRGVKDFTAHIIVRHHRYGPRPYPAELPPLPLRFARFEGLIDRYGRLLALADYYDALMTRATDFAGSLDGAAKRRKFYEDNRDEEQLIARLERAGIFFPAS